MDRGDEEARTPRPVEERGSLELWHPWAEAAASADGPTTRAAGEHWIASFEGVIAAADLAGAEAPRVVPVPEQPAPVPALAQRAALCMEGDPRGQIAPQTLGDDGSAVGDEVGGTVGAGALVDRTQRHALQLRLSLRLPALCRRSSLAHYGYPAVTLLKGDFQAMARIPLPESPPNLNLWHSYIHKFPLSRKCLCSTRDTMYTGLCSSNCW